MYVTDAQGKIVQFQYGKDDSDDELMYQTQAKITQPGVNLGIMSAQKNQGSVIERQTPGK
jgi:hypothetical protein